MKNQKILPLLLILVLTLPLTLSGCRGENAPSDFAQVIVQGTLDATYKGQYDKEFSEVSTVTKQDAEEMFQANLEGEADFFSYLFDVSELSDKSMDALVEFYKEVYLRAKYEVHPSIEDGEDFLIDVDIYPMDIIKEFYDSFYDDVIIEFNARYDAGEFDELSNEEYEDEYVDALLKALEPMVGDIEYGEKQTVTFRLIKDPEDGLYVIEDEMAADDYIIDYFF